MVKVARMAILFLCICATSASAQVVTLKPKKEAPAKTVKPPAEKKPEKKKRRTAKVVKKRETDDVEVTVTFRQARD